MTRRYKRELSESFPDFNTKFIYYRTSTSMDHHHHRVKHVACDVLHVAGFTYNVPY
jgi:hypothetical protein